MRFITLLVLILFTNSCATNNQAISYKRDPRWDLADEVYDNEIGRKVFWQLKKEENLQVCESGWALRGGDKIRVMHCSFDYYNEMTIEEARILLLKAVTLYLETINQNKRIPALLENFPFKSENVEVCIFFKKPNGSILSPEKLHLIVMQGGSLKYMTSPHGFLKTIYEETFEEACAKVGSTVENAEYQEENKV